MSYVRLDRVSVTYARPVLQDGNLSVNDGDRIGIVGINGGGKSTLLKCIVGDIEPSEGRVFRSGGVRFGVMEQDIPDGLRQKTLYEVVSAALPAADRDANTWKVDMALDALQAPQAYRTRPINELSGGWQRLALIARLGVSEPDVMVLDEPTNHLDAEKMFVLERWLTDLFGSTPLLAVSHDRAFLAHCTNKTLFLRGARLVAYPLSYERAKQLLLDDERTVASQRARELKEMDRLQRSAHELRQIGINNRSDAALRKSAQIAKRARAIESELPYQHEEGRRDIRLGTSSIQAKRLVAIRNAVIRTPDARVLFSIDRLDIQQGDRIVILGRNGCGKSRFLNWISEAFARAPDSDDTTITVTPTANLGRIDQHLSHLPLDKSLRDYAALALALDDTRSTGALVNAGFPLALHQTPLGLLSHGQRARMALLALRHAYPNFYLMDEPTNHLDIDGQEQLEFEIREVGATSIVVSHDRAFVKGIGTRFLMIDGGRLQPIDAPEAYYDLLFRTGDADRAAMA
jgi:ATPase subunit of ABC transporter with duplicated ATPase domains